jgi:hypothetical protein
MHLVLIAQNLILQACPTAQAATLSSSKSSLLPPIEQANAFWHQEIQIFPYSELGFCSHTGLNLAHGIIATLSGDVLTHRPECPCAQSLTSTLRAARLLMGRKLPFQSIASDICSQMAYSI